MPMTDQIITLVNRHGMQIKLSNWGATWLSCQLPLSSKTREVLLGCESLEQYQQQQAYLGATIGRYANRITNASICIQDKPYKLSANQGTNQLHGGELGFDKQLWQVLEQSQQAVTFRLISADGDQGFPGQLTVQVSYTLTDTNQVIITFKATTTKLTPVNLTNHAYFNLDGDSGEASDARQQQLQINANYFLPVDANGLPRTELTTVSKEDMDLRQAKRLSQNFLASRERQYVQGYDHAYLLDKRLPFAAKLISADKKVILTMQTTMPALQVYTGNFLQGTLNRYGGQYSNFAGVALEAQFLPDSPNHLEWPQPSCWLAPEQLYHHQTCYDFCFN